jgi:DNA end-binding protein Ku
MPARPAWSGHLKLSLVTCPVALYKAVEPAKRGVSFNLINPETGNRVRMKPVDEADAAPAYAAVPAADRPRAAASHPAAAPAPRPLDRAELVKGYEVEKGQYVTVTDEEIRNLRIESNGAIQIERFVPEAEIDRVYWDTPYYLAPDGEVACEPYAVIREAMREAGQVALARVVMNGREHQLALEVRGKGVVAHKIRTHQEVRAPDELFARIPDAEPDKKMVAIAKQILQQHEGPFDPAAFVDRYQEALRALIARKQAEQGVTRSSKAAVGEAEVIDLMEALRRSLAGAAQGAPAPAAERRKRGKGAAATPAAAKPARRVRKAS